MDKNQGQECPDPATIINFTAYFPHPPWGRLINSHVAQEVWTACLPKAPVSNIKDLQDHLLSLRDRITGCSSLVEEYGNKTMLNNWAEKDHFGLIFPSGFVNERDFSTLEQAKTLISSIWLSYYIIDMIYNLRQHCNKEEMS